MSTARPFRQVDVFAARPTEGNPVAVVLEAGGMTDAAMQAFARWTNLSETCFVGPGDPDADYSVRIFTPAAELPFAGHPTLGTAHALLASRRVTPRDGRLRQRCAHGIVDLRTEADDALSLRLPRARALTIDEATRERLARALNGARIRDARLVDVGAVWLTVELGDATEVDALAPDLPAIAALGHTGVTVFGARSGSGDADIEVRSFAPAHGIDEDPVCGSGNGCVAAVLASRGHRVPYVAAQGRAVGRRGRIRIAYEGDDIFVGGHCVTVIEGTAHL